MGQIWLRPTANVALNQPVQEEGPSPLSDASLINKDKSWLSLILSKKNIVNIFLSLIELTAFGILYRVFEVRFLVRKSLKIWDLIFEIS